MGIIVLRPCTSGGGGRFAAFDQPTFQKLLRTACRRGSDFTALKDTEVQSPEHSSIRTPYLCTYPETTQNKARKAS